MTDHSADLWFPTKAEAFRWYTDQGGQRQRASFYEAIPSDGKRVSRLSVSEMLRREAGARREAVDYGELEGKKASLEVAKLEMEVERRQIENRREDDKWLLKDAAYAHMAALVGTLRDALRHHFHAGQGMLVHLSGGDPGRGPELYEGCEEILAKAFNDIAAAGRIEAVFEEGEEG